MQNEAPDEPSSIDAGDETYVDEMKILQKSATLTILLELDLDRNGIKDASSVEDEIIDGKER